MKNSRAFDFFCESEQAKIKRFQAKKEEVITRQNFFFFWSIKYISEKYKNAVHVFSQWKFINFNLKIQLNFSSSGKILYGKKLSSSSTKSLGKAKKNQNLKKSKSQKNQNIV